MKGCYGIDNPRIKLCGRRGERRKAWTLPIAHLVECGVLKARFWRFLEVTLRFRDVSGWLEIDEEGWC